jgi:hypothetical protein
LEEVDSEGAECETGEQGKGIVADYVTTL